ENLLMLAIQERLQSQLRPNASLLNHQLNLCQSSAAQDVNRLFQQMLPLLGLPPFLPGFPGPLDLGCLPGTSMSHPLWQHNLCAWPECNQPCENLTVFLNHLSQVHTFNERSTSDMRVQVELVDNLEHRLTKERNRLQAMMQHLHMKQSSDTVAPSLLSVYFHAKNTYNTTVADVSAVLHSSEPEMVTSMQFTTPNASVTQTDGNLNGNRIINSFSKKPSFFYMSSTVEEKNSRLQEFYRTNDVRPPYTYASLIRQAIMESPECQLTLNEIYTWFTETFAYFRRNAATWKNAVRHNLSLHKCFQRVEQNVKGAVWTVDDSEFYRRRPQRTAATRSQPNTP
ncbi:hypothetical protein Angca_006679, partial [Angiostrongylus cantonensis]